MNKLIRNKIITNIKYLLGIFLLGELFFYALNFFVNNNYFSGELVYFWNVIFLCLIALFFYHTIIFSEKICKSKRYDILLSIFIASLFLLHNNNLITALLNNVIVKYLLMIDLGLLIIIFYIHPFTQSNKKRKNEPLFLSDESEEDSEKDILGFKDDARVFAEQVLNNNSPNSMVFGIDAPWGSGKTTYLNFCKEFWKKQPDIIIFDFNPLRFENRSNLFKIFVNELLKKINEKHYIPEISNAFHKYANFIKKINLGIFELDFSGFTNTKQTKKYAFELLKENMEHFDGKIIIVIDDLDRLPLEDVKTIIDVVKKSFVLPNVSYILCYDTENLSTFNTDLKITATKSYGKDDNQNNADQNKTTKSLSREIADTVKIVEYFEKVVNIKKTLVCSRESLKNYLLREIDNDRTLSTGYKYFSDESFEKIKQAIEKIFDPKTFNENVNYIGDLRKLKRFLNTFRMQIAPDLNIKNIGIDFVDLFYLVLIYINYPRIFRKIYTNETEGANGFFSLLFDYNSNREDRVAYKNSSKYKRYLKERLVDEERYLLNKIFDEERFQNKDAAIEVNESANRNCAAFNNTEMFLSGNKETGKGNLEKYLMLITGRRIPNPKEEYNFHSGKIEEFIKGKKIEEIFESKEYIFSKENNAEKYRLMFFRILVENLNKIKYEKAQEVIDYILDDIKNYSVAKNDKVDIELRGNLIYSLLTILNDKGWRGGVNNTGENVVRIAKRIFGEGEEFKNKGILNKLSNNRSILGIYDMLEFRLFCSHDRSSRYFNLFSALGYHENTEAKTDGSIRDLAIQQMREISQKCFQIIKTAYIENSLNIFDEIKNISQESFYGKSYEYVKDKMGNIQENLEKEKNAMISFMIYQIANKNIDFGVGCGYYDEDKSENNNGIKKTFNEYLFNVCFNMTTKKENCIYLVDYLLIHLKRKRDYSSDAKYEYVPDFEDFTIALDKKMLVDYWIKNEEEIKKYFNGKNKTIYTYNYTAFYEEDLPELFNELDKGVKEIVKK